jgi:O-antigen/teichoic acid export membrane protein
VNPWGKVEKLTIQLMSSNTVRIAKNTLMLYFRQILIMLVGLYTVRVVLNTLGAENYGIYNVVGGVVTMFSFLSSSMSIASQRYFSFALGQADFERLKRVFSLNFIIYILIASLVFILAETIGLWCVNHALSIPPERLNAANWAYQFSILTVIVTIMTTPYMAALIARENMNIWAYVSFVEALLQLLVVYVLQLSSVDNLILYSFLLFIITVVNTAIYRFICVKKYTECRFMLYWDYSLFKELVLYASLNLFRFGSNVIKNQGINILLNVYFGPLVNAAWAIGARVNQIITSFAVNFTTAVRPQIVKSYATGQKAQMLTLVFRSSKAAFFLIFFSFYLCNLNCILSCNYGSKKYRNMCWSLSDICL